MDPHDALLPQNIRYTIVTGTVSTLASAILYGVQLVLQGICFTVLRRCASTSARARNLLLLATLSMTALSTIHVACSAATSILDLLEGSSWPDSDRLWTGVGMDAALYLNILISDAVVFWRARVLWNHKHRMIYIPGILLVCTTLGVLGYVLCMILIASSGRQIMNEPYLVLKYLAFSLSVVTNLATNLSIGYYVWLHRKAGRGFFGNGNQHTCHEKVLTFVLESGVAYTILLLLGGIISFTSRFLEIHTWVLVDTLVVALGMGMTGIYPSLLIVVVFLRKPTWDSTGNITYTQT